MDNFLILACGGALAWYLLRGRGKQGARLPKGVSGAAVDRAFDQIVRRFAEGEFASQFATSVILQANEYLVFALPKIQLCEEQVTKRGGTYSGVSVRVMKGVSVRSGSFKGAATTEVTPIDSGTLSLTSHRLVFVGAKQVREVELPRLVSIDAMDHGVVISVKGKKKAEYYRGTDVLEIAATIETDESGEALAERKTVTWRLTGEEIRKMIESLLQNPKSATA